MEIEAVVAAASAAVAVAVALAADGEVSDLLCKRVSDSMSLKLCSGFQQGPPESVVEVAKFSHDCEGNIIGMVSGDSVPLLARMIYTE